MDATRHLSYYSIPNTNYPKKPNIRTEQKPSVLGPIKPLHVPLSFSRPSSTITSFSWAQKSAEPLKVSKRTYVLRMRPLPKTAPKPYNTPRNTKNSESTSQYITMRDGVQLAVNVTLPVGLGG